MIANHAQTRRDIWGNIPCPAGGNPHAEGVNVTPIHAVRVMLRGLGRASIRQQAPRGGTPVAATSHLVLAFFKSEESAEAAGRTLEEWAELNPRFELGAVGVLVKDGNGELKTHKLGPRETGTGIGVGAVLGVIGAVATGGLTLLEGAALGAAGGGIVGALFHKGLALTDEDMARISERLDAGHAGLGALVPERQAEAVVEKLTEVGGEPELHEVSNEAVERVQSAALAPA
jgi:uncharacterized membrane protein